MHFLKKICLIFFLMLITVVTDVVSGAAADDPPPEDCLGRTMECEWGTVTVPDTGETVNDPADELVVLAAELDHDPIKIYNWVYEHIEYKWYLCSRLGSRTTYLTRRGNEWDQCSLLITLLRICGVPARYVFMEDVDPDSYSGLGCVYVEAWVPVANYRGNGSGDEKAWVPLAPWAKTYHAEDGIDLLPDGEIPEELNFDFEEYLKQIRQKTALELFEERVQEYLDVHYPGKSLKDVPYREYIDRKPGSILPTSLPVNVHSSQMERRFAEVPEAYRMAVCLYFRNENGTHFLEKTLYLPEISSKRFCLDFIPATENDASVIANYGGMCLTPRNAARLLPVLRLDGEIAAQGLPIYTQTPFVPAYKFIAGPYWESDDFHETSQQISGALINFACDSFAASPQIIEKLKKELDDISSTVSCSDYNREAYLGRMGSILMNSMLCRIYNAMTRATELMYCKRKYSVDMTLIYTFPKDLNFNTESKFLAQPKWTTDGLGVIDRMYKADNLTRFVELDSDVGNLCGNLYGFADSYNEGLIYEDWQDTYGMDATKGIMVAYQQDVQILTITRDNLSEMVGILNSQTVNRLDDSEIQDIEERVNKGETIITPVQIIDYEGMTGHSMIIQNGGSYGGLGGFILNDVHGGLTGNSDPDTSIENINDASWWDNLKAISDSVLSWFSNDDGTADLTDDNAAREVVPDGDPVDLITGEFYQGEQPDFFIHSRRFDLSLRRKYKSRLIYDGPFGYGWAWNHADRLLPLENGDIIYYNEDGIPYYFGKMQNPDGTVSYQGPAGTLFSLETSIDSSQAGESFFITHKNQVTYCFLSDGRLARKIDPFGNALIFEYTDADHPDCITAIKDALGRALTLYYNGNGKVERVTDFTGRSCLYDYDGDDLVRFTDLEGNITCYEYLKNQENSLNDHNMCKYIMPEGDFLEIGYYKNDQAAWHRNAKGETFNFQYSRLNRYGETWNEEGWYRKIFYNENHDVTRITTKDKTVELMTYDDNHNMLTHTDANGYTTTCAYDGRRNVISKSNSMGETWNYAYESPYNPDAPSEITDPMGNITRFEYFPDGGLHKKIIMAGFDPDGNIVSSPDASGFETVYTYDGYGNITAVTDARGQAEQKTYDADGLYCVSAADKNGNATSFEYYRADNSEGMPVGTIKSKTVFTDEFPDGIVTTYRYNHYHQITGVTDALGNETVYEFDANRKPTKKIAPNGAVTENIYDTARDIVTGANIIQTIDPMGGIEYFDYDRVGNRVLKTDKNGNAYRYAHDAENRLIEEIDPFGNATYYKYDGNGNRVKIIDKRGNAACFAYDAANRLVSRTDAEGHTTTWQYDANGRLIDETDARGTVTHYDYNAMNLAETKTVGYGTADARVYRYRYDALGRLIKTIDPLGNYQVIGYDANGNKIAVENFDCAGNSVNRVDYTYDGRNLLVGETDGNGHTRTYQNDALGRKIADIDAEGNRSDVAYDSVGNIITVTDGVGNTTEHVYDAGNRKVKTVYPTGEQVVFLYDANGNRVGTIERDGTETRMYYDALNRKIGVEDALGGCTTWDYDENGNRVAVTNANNEIVTFQYDALNRKIRETDADGTFQSVTYDVIGNVGRVTKRDFKVIDYAYDDFNQMRQVVVDGNPEQEFTYDALSRMTRAIDHNSGSATHTVDYQYSLLNRNIIEIQDGVSIEKDYDAAGNLTHTFYPSGKTVFRDYNGNHTLAAVSDDNGKVAGFSYDANGRIDTMTMGNGIEQSLAYDPACREISRSYDVSGITLFRMDTRYDVRGNVIREDVDLYGTAVLNVYDYDSINRLTREQKDLQETIWQYDGVGNWVYTNQNGNDENRDVNADNEYTDIGGGIAEYDANGNMTFDGEKTYEYDWKNRMTAVKISGIPIAAYTYDALNRRVTKITDATRRFYYDESQVIEEHVDAVLERIYVYGACIDDPILTEYQGIKYFYIKHRNCSIAAIADADGNIIETCDYSAFGLMKITDAAGNEISESTIGNPYGYTGRRRDPETGLWYYRNRMYSPILGRFLQRDPAGYVDGMCLYAYVKNNPIGFVDPWGLCAEEVLPDYSFNLSDPFESNISLDETNDSNNIDGSDCWGSGDLYADSGGIMSDAWGGYRRVSWDITDSYRALHGIPSLPVISSKNQGNGRINEFGKILVDQSAQIAAERLASKYLGPITGLVLKKINFALGILDPFPPSAGGDGDMIFFGPLVSTIPSNDIRK